MSTISEWFKKRRAPLLTAFIDFAKAFDSVNHSHLWNKLHGLGVSTKMLCLLQSICTPKLCQLSLTTTTFLSNSSTREG